MTPILFASICLAQRKIHEVEKLPGYEIQAVALTDPQPLFLETCVRVRGTLPLEGLWSIRVTDILDSDGQPLSIQQPMVGSADVTTENLGPVGFSPMVHHDFPTRILIKGELVHYMNIEEVASFPAVKLRTQNRASTHVPPNRDWYVPEGCKLSATTPRGLVLVFPPMPSHGYSGPGYDDMSWIPVGPDLSTVNDGLQRELRKAKAQSVSRIDAYLVPGQIVRIYEDNPKAESGIFTAQNSQFVAEPQLNVHVIRRIVDHRDKFTFLVPVQKGKDLFMPQSANSDPQKIVSWPTSLRPSTPQKIGP